ncbi:hypothetical protein ES703_12140 [subsurface metagenome]
MISLREVSPKFLNDSSSTSVIFRRSPSVLIFILLRQFLLRTDSSKSEIGVSRIWLFRLFFFSFSSS